MANFKKFLNKKAIFVIILILIAGGFFWWQNREIKGSPEDYVIKETEEGTFVENKKAGLLVKSPEGWEMKKIKDIEEGSFIIQTLDIEGKENNDIVMPPLTQGCGIEIGINYKKLSFEEIEQSAKEIYLRLEVTDQIFERMTVDNKEALKNVVNTYYAGPMIGIYVPVSDRVYSFTLIWASDEKEKCIQEFESFLETISIK